MLSRRSFARLTSTVVMGYRFAGPLSSAEAQAAVRTGISFSVMMWTLKKLGSFEENLSRVAEAGYGHVELVDEFRGWPGGDLGRMVAKMQSLGITVDAMSGLKLGFANPAGGDAFLAELKALVPTAQALGCRQIILLSGKRLDNVPASEQHVASIATLKRAAEMLGTAGITSLIEPIDRIENPTIYLDGVTEAFAIVRSVGSPHLKVLYDFYHEQRGLGNLVEKLEKNIEEVGLVHIADVPGRHQPGTGEVNFANIYRALAQLNYRGVIAMEFYPEGDVVQTLRAAREEALRCVQQPSLPAQ